MPADLHACRLCGSPYVQPIDWERPTRLRSRMRLTLRCPECETTYSGLYPSDVIDEYERELDRGTDVLIASLATLKLEGVAPIALAPKSKKEDQR